MWTIEATHDTVHTHAHTNTIHQHTQSPRVRLARYDDQAWTVLARYWTNATTTTKPSPPATMKLRLDEKIECSRKLSQFGVTVYAHAIAVALVIAIAIAPVTVRSAIRHITIVEQSFISCLSTVNLL